LLLVFLLFAVFLASCSPGHSGNNEISFVRDGHLWTIDPDGANAFEVTSNGTPVIGYEWSPDHRIFAFRTLDSDFSKTATGRHVTSNPVTGLTNDVPSVINTIGIDGGTPIPIAVPGADIQHSNAWWNPSGNRLLYREEATAVIQNAGTQSWWISQNDQPLDIARKLLPYTYSIPSLSTNDLAIGNSSQGLFTTSLAGTQFKFILQGALPGHPLPASLERVLWQPSHLNPSILYAIATETTGKVPSFLCKGGSGGVGSGDPCGRPLGSNTTAMQVQLILRDSHGQTRAIATCSCTQFAWSPDGNSVLYSTGTQYIILNTRDFSSFSVSAEDGSVPYWSPDSRFIILDGLHTLQLVSIANQRQQLLLTDVASGSNTAFSPLPDSRALLQPISNSIWASDSRQFLFLSRNRLSWQGKHLDSGKGLYTVSIDGNGRVQGTPAVVDSGNDSQASWTYEDPDTSFIF
ncbi:MAG TPA: hypothetical protein VIX20_03050, partial [Ktedonobacteraceae bacterium]